MRTVYSIHRDGVEHTESPQEAERASKDGYMVTAEVKA